MKKRVLFHIVLISLFSLVGCGNVEDYHAVFYPSAEGIRDDFADANMVRDTCYLSVDSDDFCIDDPSYPYSRIFVVQDEGKYNEIFEPGVEELETDFDKQIYTTIYMNHRDVSLKSEDYQSGKQSIIIQVEKVPDDQMDTCLPYQRWMVIKQDKIDGLADVECKLEY